MNETERVRWWLEQARRAPLQQFGQAHDGRAHDGATACTDTIIQTIHRGWTGATALTIDRIRDLAGYTDRQYAARSGLTAAQVDRVMRRLSLPYEVRPITSPLSAWRVLKWANWYGPVMVGVPYGWWPEWQGFRYGTVTADGRPNGFARPRGQAGKTQLTGFTGAHAVLVLGYALTRDAQGRVIGHPTYVKEPNHGSARRPERPPFDVIDSAQFRRAYDAFAQLGRRPYAVTPLERFTR